jgi:DNA transformation protein and related proteins
MATHGPGNCEAGRRGSLRVPALCRRPLEFMMLDDASSDRLPNLGPRSTAWLREVGVHGVEDLARLGPVVVYRLVKQRQPKASLNLLWALVAGLQGRDWRELTAAEKQRLRRELERG